MSGHVDIPQSTRCASSGTFKGVASTALILFFCLPSLIGGFALLLQLLLHGNIMEWNETASALIALGCWFGGPLVALAAFVGSIVSLTRVPAGFKYADLCVVGVATLAALSLLLKFAK